MKKIFTILVVAGAFFTVELTCAMDEALQSSKSESDTDATLDMTCEEDESELYAYSSIEWAPEEDKNWEWSQEELKDGLDVIHHYAEDEVNKVRDEYNRAPLGAQIISRGDFLSNLGRIINKLVEKAGEEETNFTIQFAESPFMAFLVAWDYFTWERCSDGKYRLFPFRGPRRMTLRNLYNEFKKGDFIGRGVLKTAEVGKRRAKAFRRELEIGKQFLLELKGVE